MRRRRSNSNVDQGEGGDADSPVDEMDNGNSIGIRSNHDAERVNSNLGRSGANNMQLEDEDNNHFSSVRPCK